MVNMVSFRILGGEANQIAMDSHNIVHVAVLPPNVVDAEQATRIASIINKSVYSTRLLFAGRIPRIIAHYSTSEQAESTIQKLRHLGITAIACEDAKLRSLSKSFSVYVLKFGEKGISFWDRSSKSIKMEPVDAFLIIRGTMETREDTEVVRSKMKLNLPATLLTGGIPIRRKITEKTVETSTKTEAFVRVYGKKSSDTNIEIKQYEFDYSCLDPPIALSSLANFTGLVTRIRNTFPQAVFDDRLTRDFSVDVPITTPWEKIDIICNLIYIFKVSPGKVEKSG